MQVPHDLTMADVLDDMSRWSKEHSEKIEKLANGYTKRRARKLDRN